ncbi:MAG: hypothetical protein A2W90_20985 [Bacteroidetes bacterium GWF2_42_66]|nr:MAG: hypothetical protein A2W92_12340 [Bacteroidetes bacterium GWA2_42_15]OFX99215.1 MAG: hypothetical protein A2W89_03665 [Bacteroidetes bacterium GWE2_42_39]OFY40611.1 MAG: hypothetical protein A2W90_20985 [Bacteroidetes bacterium GWF2_42_66]HBL74566.1 hypothetical protein [Prolixibacteraceae bacterium]HCU61286.1 hypothetical protein [Prolixibacteraceae bacterium]
MIKIYRNKLLIIIALISVFAVHTQAQISANADAVLSTEYSGGMAQDPIFIFCGSKGETNAGLQASTNMGGTISYEWQKYDAGAGVFQFYLGQPNGGSSQSISLLESGGYRVVISNGTQTEMYTAWVFNNYHEVSAEITESNCDYFQLQGAFDPLLTYYDLSTNQPMNIDKNIQLQWKEGEANIASDISTKIYDPPTSDTRYSLQVTDRFGCTGEAEVTYTSIVTKASFSVSEEGGEAPLEIEFSNESENGKPGSYEWFFFKSLEEIKEEAEKSGGVADSIDFVAYNDELTWTFENSGTYMVKLVSKHISDLHTCTDTFYLEDYIVADTSFVKAPNFFTPNGDGANDEFIVKFWSVRNIKISIFNRWGKLVHLWKGTNVQGFENTVATVTESVWDGKIGGKMASPGVYYYVVEARGRDDKNRWAHGFVHLFRDK